jgi:hypothetical protein
MLESADTMYANISKIQLLASHLDTICHTWSPSHAWKRCVVHRGAGSTLFVRVKNVDVHSLGLDCGLLV